MRAYVLLFITSYCATLPFCIAVMYGNHTFRHREDLSNKTCPETERPFIINQPSRLMCAAKCAQTSNCRGFSYNSAARLCVGCSGRYTNSVGMAAEIGSEYHEENTDNYHLSCNENNDCFKDDTICEGTNHICVCTPGYSYSPGTNSCSNGCENWGDTFEEYPGYFLEHLNEYDRDGFSYDECESHCVNANWLCRSFDREGNKCWFSTATPLTNPGSLLTDETSYLYNRNCV